MFSKKESIEFKLTFQFSYKNSLDFSFFTELIAEVAVEEGKNTNTTTKENVEMRKDYAVPALFL